MTGQQIKTIEAMKARHAETREGEATVRTKHSDHFPSQVIVTMRSRWFQLIAFVKSDGSVYGYKSGHKERFHGVEECVS